MAHIKFALDNIYIADARRAAISVPNRGPCTSYRTVNLVNLVICEIFNMVAN